MNNNERFTVIVGILLLALIVILGVGFFGMQKDIEFLGNRISQKAEAIDNLRQTTNRTKGGLEESNIGIWDSIWYLEDRIDDLEGMDKALLETDRIQSVAFSNALLRANAVLDFPYVDQLGKDAEFVEDCGSAVILMVAKYYGVAGDETVDEVHLDMAKGDYPVTYILIADYLESRYGLKTKIVTNYDWVLVALENNGFDISEIELVEEISDDQPVIWVYATEPHWIVRYQGWTFDPLNGIWPFKATEAERRLLEPQWGLGIIVVDQ